MDSETRRKLLEEIAEKLSALDDAWIEAEKELEMRQSLCPEKEEKPKQITQD